MTTEVKCPCGLSYTMFTKEKTNWRCFDCNKHVEYDPETNTINYMEV